MSIFRNLGIVGVGLIGSSLARAGRTYDAVGSVLLWDADSGVRTRAADLQLGYIPDDLASFAATCDAIALCVPVGQMAAVIREMRDHLKPGTVIFDVGSVKGAVIRDVGPLLPEGVHFVPAHPVAGTEQSGPDSGFASLFVDRWCILTPTDDTAPDYANALAQVDAFWTKIGAKTEVMTPDRHDLVLAITSHLPHLIAFNTVLTASDLERVTEGEVVKYSAGGFRDFTRIAASDPTMWRDVFLSNKDAVLEMLGRFSEDLAILQRAIRWDDGETLHKLFSRSRAIRKNIVDAGQDTDRPNFGRDPAPK